MDRKIVGFHQDEEHHWVAELECGHRQHVRHNPPWVNRPWVLSLEGRAKTLGSLLNCTQCDNRQDELVARAMPEGRSRADIMMWRKVERVRLIEARLAIEPAERRRNADQMAMQLSRVIGDVTGRVVSFYWPMRGEPDLRPWVKAIGESGGRAALPVVVVKQAPLVFRTWQPGEKLVRGVWNIPVPAAGVDIIPDIVIAPLVGFDESCYRLGYGGGYFDRTLANLLPRPLVIGVGYARTALSSILPLPHDIPMDVIVTEQAVLYRSGCTSVTTGPVT